MTSTLVRPVRAHLHGHVAGRRHVVPLIAVAAVVVRLAMLPMSAGADESGYLMIAQQWHTGGSSLYGNYWVDRPPLLISIFALAAHLGGLVALRLIGVLATVAVVLGSGHVARRTAGRRAGPWAAFVAALLCVSPFFGGAEVNGELLSAPFVVLGIGAALEALRSNARRRAVVSAAVAGAAFVAALLIKQNIADVGVFSVAAALVAWHRREIAAHRVCLLALAFAGGAAGFLAVVALWTVAHGTSVAGVFDAMYPFRIAAGRVMAASGNSHATSRLGSLAANWVLGGGAVIMVAAVWATASRRLGGTVERALVATLAFDLVSIALGGNFWRHYLMQLVVPLAILAGVMVARHLPALRTALTLTAVLAAAAWIAVLPGRGPSEAAQLGTAIGASAQPRDTIVTVYGHANVSQTTELSSPYPYLWSLPIKTRDPQLNDLNAVLRGPSAPTWFVTWSHVGSWGVDSATTRQLIADLYHPVARLHGHTVYLRDGITRTPPHLAPKELS